MAIFQLHQKVDFLLCFFVKLCCHLHISFVVFTVLNCLKLLYFFSIPSLVIVYDIDNSFLEYIHSSCRVQWNVVSKRHL